ncbi:MAG TPA: hypothetical protein DEX20_03910 [Halieaceae bacterium]|nr:hypothetical protein [Halieaceae bacterium]
MSWYRDLKKRDAKAIELDVATFTAEVLGASLVSVLRALVGYLTKFKPKKTLPRRGFGTC